MVNRILQLLSIRCSHKKLSQPFAASSPVAVQRAANSQWDAPAGVAAQHYVVCLECGHKFEYDWNNMRVVAK
jgi:putative hemolysin